MVALAITAPHFHLSPRLRAAVAEKIDRLQRYTKGIERADVHILKESSGAFRIGVALHRDHGPAVLGHGDHASVYGALSKAVNIVRKRTCREHNKLAGHR